MSTDTSRKPSSPIFIIGSYRSGTSVLTWCLGQHPNILALEETNWMGYLSVYLDNLYLLGTINKDFSNLSSIGISEREFNCYFGRCVDNFIKENLQNYLEAAKNRALENPELITENYKICESADDPKGRWIDGTPENSHFVYGLNKLFPDAKFIHLLRNPKSVALSLQRFSSVGGKDYAEEEAYRTWMRLVRASVEAEESLGPDKVIRVHYDDIVERPDYVIRKCLEFVGEPYNESCLSPLNKRINSSGNQEVADISIAGNLKSHKDYIKEAFELYQHLMQKHNIAIEPDSSVSNRFEDTFLEFAKQFRLEEIDKLSDWGCSLDKDIEQRDQHIYRLQKEVLELGNWGKGLDQLVIERDMQITELKKQLALKRFSLF